MKFFSRSIMGATLACGSLLFAANEKVDSKSKAETEKKTEEVCKCVDCKCSNDEHCGCMTMKDDCDPKKGKCSSCGEKCPCGTKCECGSNCKCET